MRWHIVEEFKSVVSEVFRSRQEISVALVGGYSTDPELALIKDIFNVTKIDFYGIDCDTDFKYLDLNETGQELENSTYDLVICSQVIEHVWNTSNFFRNLSKLTKVNGFLWIACPASNIPHGSPQYYSAGYAPQFLIKNIESLTKWRIHKFANIGSKRNYLATHSSGSWLTENELRNPVRNYQFQPGTKLGIIRKYIKDLPVRILLITVPNEVSSEIRWATETYVFAQKLQ